MKSTKIHGFEVYYENEKETRGLVREIFRDHTYFFETENPEPIIIDVGAHIGLATLYFKKLYPHAKVFAVEPNPAALHLLKLNLEVNHIQDVMIIPVAVSDAAGLLTLYADETQDKWHSTDSFKETTWDGVGDRAPIQVESITLNNLVYGTIDLCKLDVEGMEQRILEGSKVALANINKLCFEYHPVPGNNLQKLGQFLKDQGFLVTCYKHKQIVPLAQARGLVLVEAVKK